MGSCNSKDKDIVVHQPKKDSAINNKKHTEMLLEKHIETIDPKFKDMPEWEGERYKGEGIKKMKGYKCEMQIDKLSLLRDDFWNSKTKDKLIWKHIRQACIMDDETIDNCLNNLIDEKNHLYHIPNFCINDPFFEKQIVANDNVIITDDILKLFVTNLYENKKIEVEVGSCTTGAELKKVYYKKSGEDVTNYRTRLFFGGTEIKDDHKLYQHNLKNEYQIQIIKNLIE